MILLFYFFNSFALSFKRFKFTRILDELFVLGILSLVATCLPRPMIKPLVAIFLFLTQLHYCLLKHFNFPLLPELYPHFFRPFAHLKSASEAGISLLRPLLYFLSNLALLSLLPHTVYWPGIAFLLFGCAPALSNEHVILLFLKRMLKKKKKGSISAFSFPCEKGDFINPRYPYLRSTRQFLGEKRFSIRIEKEEKPHVIFCFLESFRPQSLSYAPRLQSLINEGIYFSQFYSNSNLTDSALISSLFGIFPKDDLRPNFNDYEQLPLIGLPKIMKGWGYTTALLEGATMDSLSFAHASSFDTVIDKKALLKLHPNAPQMGWGVHDEVTFSVGADWLSKQKQSVFLSMMTLSTHFPWVLPASWTSAKGIQKVGYFEAVSYTDEMLFSWIERLRQEGILEKSILFFFGDHGQEFGEHPATHVIRNTIYEEHVQVPLLIYAPGRIAKPMTIDDPCSQIDLLPTVLDLFNSRDLHHSLGTSLLRKKRKLIYFNSPIGSQIGCRLGDWKAIIGKAKEELYNLKSDPKEAENVAALYPQRMKRLKEVAKKISSSMQEAYDQKAFCPPGKELYYTPDKHIDDKTLASILAKKKNLYSLNLSSCQRLTGQDINLPSLRELDLSNCLNIDFAGIAKKHPHLHKLNLSYCPFLTDEVLDEVIQQCRDLRDLRLVGNVELQTIKAQSFESLKILDLRDCLSLDVSWLDWINAISNLEHLYLSCFNWNDSDFRRLKPGKWSYLGLSSCQSVKSESIVKLIDNSPNLIWLRLLDCSITDSELQLAIKNKKWFKNIIIKSETKSFSIKVYPPSKYLY